MGGKSGGGQVAPYEAPNSLSSAQSLRIIDAICEGVVSGFANGDDAPLKSVYFNDTPVQNDDGTFNFKGVGLFFQRGTPDQSYIPGFDTTERTVSVAAAVKKAVPVVRAVTDGLVSRLRVTVGVERNAQVRDNGDTVAAETLLLVELVNKQGVKASQAVRFNEKSSGIYYEDIVFDSLPDVPFNIRVSRQTPDSSSDKTNNNTYFASYVEIIDSKLSYPNTALAALVIDSDQFGNSNPRRNYLLNGQLVNVPSNYDPIQRSYGAGVWDGSFKKAWTNNPAWIFYDVLTQPRYSTLARRLKLSDIDKWTLYEIAKYCDEPVADGFGGTEPRFVCNAYISDRRQAGELLSDLASVFTGLAVWNGSQVSVVMDADSDPVAMYSNSNVVKGEFTYSGAALKSIHTAVHVQYVDKYDGYRTKTEYIADDEAIARYGLNIKQVTAFGCDSRGQAARFGAWTLQTELRQQNMVSFTVGREGLRHLPYDIVQVMDNDYAGAELSGRVLAVSGKTVTLDRAVQNAVGTLLYCSTPGGLKPVKVVQQPKDNQLMLERVDGIAPEAVWALSGKVKPRLYRAVGIKENTEDGTYTVTALLHDPKKYAAVDTSIKFDREITTLHTIQPVLTNGDVRTENGALVITWDNLTADGNVLTYDIKVYRNNRLYRHIPDAPTAEIRLENLPEGGYKAEIRGRNARGVLSDPLVKAWQIDYTVTGVRTTPKMLSVGLDWVLPATAVTDLTTEIWYSKTNNQAEAEQLAVLPYPQNSYTLTGVAVTDRYWFWLRLRDNDGNSGEFTAAVQGMADSDPAPIVEMIQGQIAESALTRGLLQGLHEQAQSAAETAADAATAAAQEREAELSAHIRNIKQEIDGTVSRLGGEIDQGLRQQAETSARQAETAARQARQELQTVSDGLNRDLSTLRREMGSDRTRYNNSITELQNGQSAETRQREALAGRVATAEAAILRESSARAEADRSESAARQALANRLGTAESQIAEEKRSRSEQERATAQNITVLSTRLGTAEGGIRDLSRSVTDLSGTLNTRYRELTAEIQGIGAVNLLADSEYTKPAVWNNKARLIQTKFNGRQLSRVNATEAQTAPVGISQHTDTAQTRIVKGRTYTLSLNAQGTAGFVATGLNYVYLLRNSEEGGNFRLDTIPINASLGVRRKLTFTAPWTSNTVRLLIGANGTFAANDWFAFHSVKLEGGSVATDWSATPEDVDNALAGTAAAVTRLEEAKASQERATAAEIATLKSRLNTAESELTAEKRSRAQADQAESSARETLANRLGQAESQLAAEKRSRAETDRAVAQDISGLTTRTAAAEGRIRDMAKSVSDLSGTVNQRYEALEANYRGLSVGGRNLLLGSKTERSTHGTTSLQVSSNIDFANLSNLVLSCDVAYTNAKRSTGQGAKWFRVGAEVRIVYTDGSSTYCGVWQLVTEQAANFGGRIVRKFAVPQGKTVQSIDSAKIQIWDITADSITVKNPKLEIGTVATDWTPAPEDAEANTAAQVERLERAAAEKDRTTAERLQRAESRLGAAETKVTNLESSAVTRQQAEGIAESRAAAKFQEAQTAVDALKRTVADNKAAQAADIRTVNSSINNVSAQVRTATETVTRLDGTVTAMHKITAETVTGGRKVVSGLSFGTNGSESQFLVFATKFGLVDPASKQIKLPFVVTTENGRAKMALDGDMLATGTIQGKHIAASSTLQAPTINGGTLNAAAMNAGSINIGNGNFIVDRNGNLTAKSGRFEGVIQADKIEGDVLKMIQFQRESEGVYTLYLPPYKLERACALQGLSIKFGSLEGVAASLSLNGEVVVSVNLSSSYSHTYETGRNTNAPAYTSGSQTIPFFCILPANKSAIFKLEITKSEYSYSSWNSDNPYLVSSGTPRDLDFAPFVLVCRT